MQTKRGISPVIATVLLLLLTVVIVGVLAYFVVPFVNNNLKTSGDCFDLLNKIKLEENEYSCYITPVAQNDPGRSAFTLRVDYELPIDVKVLLYKQGRTSADTITLRDSQVIGGVRMLEDSFSVSSPLVVPYRGNVRTYVVDKAYERVEANPVLKSGKVCNEQQSITLHPCIDSVRGSLLN